MKKNNKEQKNQLVTLFVTFFGVGKMKMCPGTFGSIATLPLWVIVNLLLAAVGFTNLISVILFWIILITIIFFLGIKASDLYIKQNGKAGDPQEIVIDEVAGQLIAFLSGILLSVYFMSQNLEFLSEKADSLMYQFLSGFMVVILPIVMFRIFDIKKPWIIGYCDKKIPGGLGVMLDDIVAGIFASISLVFIYFIYYECIIGWL